MKIPLWLTLVASSVALALYVEWHTDEPTVVLAVLLVLAVAIGATKPALAPAGGALLGFSILVAHAVTESAPRMRPQYMHSAPSLGDWAAMAILGVVITAVALGAGLARVKLAGGEELTR